MKNIKNYDSFNSNVNESSFENKTFNVCLAFFKEKNIPGDHAGFQDDVIALIDELHLSPLEGSENDKEMLILEALSDLSMFKGPNSSAELRKIEEDFDIDEAIISEFAKRSKSLKDFKFLVHEKLVEDNFPLLMKNFIARDGEEDTTMEEILEDPSWMEVYGCEFEINKPPRTNIHGYRA